jgi:hypothetical protein
MIYCMVKRSENSIREDINPAQQCSVTYQRTMWNKINLAAQIRIA